MIFLLLFVVTANALPKQDANSGESTENLSTDLNLPPNLPLELAQFLVGTVNTVDSGIPEKVKEEIKKNCKNGKCKGQLKKVVEQKQKLRKHLSKAKGGSTDATEEVDRQFAKTFELKKRMLEKAGLGDTIEPADDGLFQGDMILSTEQAEAMMGARKKKKGSKKRVARSSVFFEENPQYKFDVSKPINYSIHNAFTGTGFDVLIRRTLSEITRAVPCIKFKEYIMPKVKGEFVKPSPGIYFESCQGFTFCQSSAVGLQMPYTLVQISNRKECNGENQIFYHSVLHALGVVHQHSREDRDQFIDLDWWNILTPFHDKYLKPEVSNFSVYGVPYDFRSVMHYPAFTDQPSTVRDINKPVIKTKDPVYMSIIGKATQLSNGDITLLKRMYCRPANCKDKYPDCGVLALYGGPKVTSKTWLQNNCKKSMNLC